MPGFSEQTTNSASKEPRLTGQGTEEAIDSAGTRINSMFLFAVLVSFILTSLFFVLESHSGISFADEGYLWYGSIRASEGDIPIRDFQSYDPGRYYWNAAWFHLFGDGIIDLRLSAAIFQFIGLTFGLLALSRVIRSLPGLAMSGVLISAWMLPRHKLYDVTIILTCIYMSVWLLENPNWRRHLGVGIFVGLAAFFGRNHGIYTISIMFLLIMLDWFKGERENLARRLSVFSGGVVIGYSPMLLMCLIIPGMSQALLDSVRVLLSSGGPGIPMHIPWPWTLQLGSNTISRISDIYESFSFLLLPGFVLGSIIFTVMLPRNSLGKYRLLTATGLTGLFYMHHLFTRAGFGHLAQSIHPLLIGLLSMIIFFKREKSRRIAIGVFILASVGSAIATLPHHPLFLRLQSPKKYVSHPIGEDSIWIRRHQAELIQNIKATIDERATPEEPIVMAPHIPGMYPILQRQSPIFQSYLCRPSPEKWDLRNIADLKTNNVNWIILGRAGIDNLEERDFTHFNPVLWQYIRNEYREVDSVLAPEYRLFQKKWGEP